MIFPKKVVVAVDLSSDMEEILYPIRKMSFMKDAELFFVHVAMSVNYSPAFEVAGVAYPLLVDKSVIEKAVEEKLISMQDKIVPYGHVGQVHFNCFFAGNGPQAFCDFAKEHNADLVIVAPRKKRGIFESSFAQFVCRHSEANVLLLKPH